MFHKLMGINKISSHEWLWSRVASSSYFQLLGYGYQTKQLKEFYAEDFFEKCCHMFGKVKKIFYKYNIIILVWNVIWDSEI